MERHKQTPPSSEDEGHDDNSSLFARRHGNGRDQEDEMDDLTVLLNQLSQLRSGVSSLYSSVRSTIYALLTSRTVQKTVISSALLLVSSLILYAVAVVAYLFFYYAYLPQLVSSHPVHLQYGYGLHPFGILESLDFRDRQLYDVHVELTLPKTPENARKGNWMVVMHLTSAPTTVSGGTAGAAPNAADYMTRVVVPAAAATAQDKDLKHHPYHHQQVTTVFDLGSYMRDRETVYTTARPAILPYEDALVSTAGRMMFLPWHILFPKQAEATTLRVGMAERLMFRRGQKLPKGMVVEVQAGQGLQVYSARVVLTAQLGGLRWVMYRWKVASFVVITGGFWVVEMGMMMISLVVVGGWLSAQGAGGGPKTEEEEELEKAADEKGKRRVKIEEGAGMSDTERTFPTSRGQPPLKYESSSHREASVKKEEEDEGTVIKVPDIGLEGDDEEEDEGSGWRDSGIGTSYSDAARREGVVKRRAKKTSGS